MRVDIYDSIHERRDATDQRWYKFLKKCNLFPILLPNFEETMLLIEKIELSGILLTGGNTLETLGGDASERDALEKKLIDYAILRGKPLLGVCRGMQIIQTYFGVKLQLISDHIATRHDTLFNDQYINVNSYHQYAAFDSTKELEVEARCADGAIEAIQHNTYPIKGIMWHPEREAHSSTFDIDLFKKHFHAYP